MRRAILKGKKLCMRNLEEFEKFWIVEIRYIFKKIVKIKKRSRINTIFKFQNLGFETIKISIEIIVKSIFGSLPDIAATSRGPQQ